MTSDDEDAEANSGNLRDKRHQNRVAARQFIDSMATVKSESESDRDEKEDDASIIASDNSFIVGDDIFD